MTDTKSYSMTDTKEYRKQLLLLNEKRDVITEYL